MPKTRERVALTVRLSPSTMALLGGIQLAYGRRMGDTAPVSQSKAVELMIRETSKREKVK